MIVFGAVAPSFGMMRIELMKFVVVSDKDDDSDASVLETTVPPTSRMDDEAGNFWGDKLRE